MRKGGRPFLGGDEGKRRAGHREKLNESKPTEESSQRSILQRKEEYQKECPLPLRAQSLEGVDSSSGKSLLREWPAEKRLKREKQ